MRVSLCPRPPPCPRPCPLPCPCCISVSLYQLDLLLIIYHWTWPGILQVSRSRVNAFILILSITSRMSPQRLAITVYLPPLHSLHTLKMRLAQSLSPPYSAPTAPQASPTPLSRDPPTRHPSPFMTSDYSTCTNKYYSTSAGTYTGGTLQYSGVQQHSTSRCHQGTSTYTNSLMTEFVL